MMAMTTKSSISVKADRGFLNRDDGLMEVILKRRKNKESRDLASTGRWLLRSARTIPGQGSRATEMTLAPDLSDQSRDRSGRAPRTSAAKPAAVALARWNGSSELGSALTTAVNPDLFS